MQNPPVWSFNSYNLLCFHPSSLFWHWKEALLKSDFLSLNPISLSSSSIGSFHQLCCALWRRGRRATASKIEALGSDWMCTSEQDDEFDPHTIRLPAFVHLSTLNSFCRDFTFPSPPSPGLFPCHCNGPVSVSLNHNIWNGVIINSWPHSSFVPQLTHTNRLWISIHLLCLPQAFSFHHWKINVCKLQHCDWRDTVSYRVHW